MGRVIFCLSLRPGLKTFRTEFAGEGVESFDSIDEIALGLLGVTENTARVIPFFRIELDGIDIVAIPAKTIIWLLHLKRHVPTMAYVSILASVDVRISERGRGVAVVGVSIGTEEYAVDNSGKGSDLSLIHI